MKFGHFDLNLLVALDALLDTRSVSRASERLHIGASATSSALGRLRDYFEDPLLMQIGRKMELTPLGRSLVQPVREILLNVQSTVVARLDMVSTSPAQTLRELAGSAPDDRRPYRISVRVEPQAPYRRHTDRTAVSFIPVVTKLTERTTDERSLLST